MLRDLMYFRSGNHSVCMAKPRIVLVALHLTCSDGCNNTIGSDTQRPRGFSSRKPPIASAIACLGIGRPQVLADHNFKSLLQCKPVGALERRELLIPPAKSLGRCMTFGR